MRILRFCFAFLLLGVLVHQTPAAPAAKASKKKAAKPARVDTLTVKTVDTLKVKDTAGLARQDSLANVLRGCESGRRSADSLLGLARLREASLGKSLDSTKRFSSDQSILLGRQKDSLRILDSLRRATAPDSNFVLFLPVSYDTTRHPGDSTLARALSRNLLASALSVKGFELWTPMGSELRCNQPECWSTIARRKGAGQILTGVLSYSGDTLIYSSFMTSMVAGQVTRQSQVVGYHRESDPAPRFSRMAASQLFGIKDEETENKHVDSPLWRRVMLLGIFGIFAGTAVALSW
jgi:hypothetical protein